MLPMLAAAVVVAVLPEPLAAEAFEEAELAALDAALDAALALLEATLDALEAALDSAEERALDPDASILETADETDATMDDETSGGTLSVNGYTNWKAPSRNAGGCNRVARCSRGRSSPRGGCAWSCRSGGPRSSSSSSGIGRRRYNDCTDSIRKRDCCSGSSVTWKSND
jgi:hypothetical protein